MSKLDGQIRLLEWKDLGDERGNLVVVEGNMMVDNSVSAVILR